MDSASLRLHRFKSLFEAHEAPRYRANIGRWIACILIAYFAGGCATLTLGTIGTVVGSIASPVQGILSSGKAHAAELADFGTAGVAVRQAADDLGMHLDPIPPSEQSKDPTVLELAFVDDKRNRLRVTLEQRSRTLAMIEINTGFFGPQSVANLFLERFRKHLSTPNAGAHDR